MRVVFGVDFGSLDAALANALRGIDDARATVVPTGCGLAYDTLLRCVESDPEVEIAAALAEAAGTGAEVVAIGAQALEVAALDAGASDFVEWPTTDHSLKAQIGAAARRIRRGRQQRGDFERLRRLDAIRVRFLAADIGLDALLQMICDEVLASEDLRSMTGAEGAVVEMVAGDDIVFRAAAGTLREHRGYRLPRERSLSHLVVDTREIQCSVDTADDPRVNAKACEAVGVRSMVAAPLICNGQAVGTLKLVSSVRDAFNALDLRILAHMAEMASAATQREIEKKRLSDDLAARTNALAEMERDRESLRALAGTDPLTGLANRRQFDSLSEAALRRGAGRRPGLAVLALDLDQFKQVNDSHGHAAGDAVLVAVAGWLTAAIRDGDILGRLGGEEFGIVLTRVDQDTALATAERIRAAVEAGAVPWDGGWIRTSVSVGVTIIAASTTIEEALHRADSALYRAKDGGRNRIVLHEGDTVVRFPGNLQGQ